MTKARRIAEAVNQLFPTCSTGHVYDFRTERCKTCGAPRCVEVDGVDLRGASERIRDALAAKYAADRA